MSSFAAGEAGLVAGGGRTGLFRALAPAGVVLEFDFDFFAIDGCVVEAGLGRGTQEQPVWHLLPPCTR